MVFGYSLGQVIDTDGLILLDDVPVITPNGDVVVPSLSFKVEINLN
jgi:ATP-binding cassette subfamily D (ALD) protein 2